MSIFGDLIARYESIESDKIPQEFQQSLIKLRNQYIDLYGERVIRKILDNLHKSLKPIYSRLDNIYNIDMLKGHVKAVLDRRNNREGSPLNIDDEDFLYKYLEDEFPLTKIDSTYTINSSSDKTSSYDKTYTANYFLYTNNGKYKSQLYGSELCVIMAVESNSYLGFQLKDFYKLFDGEMYNSITQITDNKSLNELVHLCEFNISINGSSIWELNSKYSSFDKFSDNLKKVLDRVSRKGESHSKDIDDVIKKYTYINSPLNQSSNFTAQKFIKELLDAYVSSRQGEFLKEFVNMSRKLKLTLL